MTVNFVQIETKTGIKEFELVHADITSLPFEVDILCISAFKNDYEPTESSVIGQLYVKGTDIALMSKNPRMDFRESLGIWVSHEIAGRFFKNIVCVEITRANETFIGAVRNLFAVISTLEIQGLKITSIALPLIGAGNQAYDEKMVISSLLDVSLDFLKYSRYLSKVYFVVKEKQTSNLFSNMMNDVLGRDKIKSPSGALANLLKSDLEKCVDEVIELHKVDEVFSDLKRVLNSDFRPFEFGAITRKTIEKLIERIEPPSTKEYELYKRIDLLANLGISPWILSYFHTIRVFGNEAVHTKDRNKRIPEYVDEKDLEVGMYCMAKIINFYLNYQRGNNGKHQQ